MKIIGIVIAILIFSATITLFNELNIFNQQIYEPAFSIPKDDVESVFKVDGAVQETSSGIGGTIVSLVESTIGFMYLLGNTFAIALNLGGLFSTFIPGVVGQQIALVINGIVYFVYLIGGIQAWRKISTKGMD